MNGNGRQRFAVMAELGIEESVSLSLLGMPEISRQEFDDQSEARSEAARRAINQSPHSFDDLSKNDLFVYPVGDISVIAVSGLTEQEESPSTGGVDKMLDRLSDSSSDYFAPPELEYESVDELEQSIKDAATSLPVKYEQMFDEQVIKDNLKEVCLFLILLNDGGMSGQDLIDAIWKLFGCRLSPGTIYPKLNELAEDGVCVKTELVRTKEYDVEDEDAVYQRLSRSADKHLGLGFLFHVASTEDR